MGPLRPLRSTPGTHHPYLSFFVFSLWSPKGPLVPLVSLWLPVSGHLKHHLGICARWNIASWTQVELCATLCRQLLNQFSLKHVLAKRRLFFLQFELPVRGPPVRESGRNSALQAPFECDIRIFDFKHILCQIHLCHGFQTSCPRTHPFQSDVMCVCVCVGAGVYVFNIQEASFHQPWRRIRLGGGGGLLAPINYPRSTAPDSPFKGKNRSVALLLLWTKSIDILLG